MLSTNVLVPLPLPALQCIALLVPPFCVMIRQAPQCLALLTFAVLACPPVPPFSLLDVALPLFAILEFPLQLPVRPVLAFLVLAVPGVLFPVRGVAWWVPQRVRTTFVLHLVGSVLDLFLLFALRSFALGLPLRHLGGGRAKLA